MIHLTNENVIEFLENEPNYILSKTLFMQEQFSDQDVEFDSFGFLCYLFREYYNEELSFFCKEEFITELISLSEICSSCNNAVIIPYYYLGKRKKLFCHTCLTEQMQYKAKRIEEEGNFEWDDQTCDNCNSYGLWNSEDYCRSYPACCKNLCEVCFPNQYKECNSRKKRKLITKHTTVDNLYLIS